MSDQKNIQLNDELMANAAGGTGTGSIPVAGSISDKLQT